MFCDIYENVTVDLFGRKDLIYRLVQKELNTT